MLIRKIVLLLLLCGWPAACTAALLTAHNENISLRVNISEGGITLTSIRDVKTNHEYLIAPTVPTPFFELSVFDFSGGNPTPVSTHVIADTFGSSGDQISIAGHLSGANVSFKLTIQTADGDPAAVLRMWTRNEGIHKIYLKAVFPKITGLVTPGDAHKAMGAVPQEIGSVSPLWHLAPAGASIAAIRKDATQEDVFVAGDDGYLELTSSSNILSWMPGPPLGAARGPKFVPSGACITALEHDGGQEDIFIVASDGSIQALSFNHIARRLGPANFTMNPGSCVAAVMRNPGWQDIFAVGSDGVQIISIKNGIESSESLLNSQMLAGPGACITALARNPQQEDIFLVDQVGALQTYFEKDSIWYGPIRLSSTHFAEPGACVAGTVRGLEEDLFVVKADGSIQRLYESNNSPWQSPQSLTAPGFADPHSQVTALVAGSRIDVFAVKVNGAIQVFNGLDSPWPYPTSLTPPNYTTPTARLAALMRHIGGADEEDFFVVDVYGSLATLYRQNDNAWIGPTVIRGGPPLGMLPNSLLGLPTAMNTMEVASIYDPQGHGGVFFADLEGDVDQGRPPIQFCISWQGVGGFWASLLDPGQSVDLPALAIGVHSSGDWHMPVGFYEKHHRPFWHFPAVPHWFREAGAIYTFSGGGAGGVYLDPRLPTENLFERMNGAFANLPSLLQEAKKLGTNVIYVWDYWDRRVDSGPADQPCISSAYSGSNAYSMKGDYCPRSSMGGEEQLKRAIEAIHEQNGRIIFYVEPFIVHHMSRIGNQHGEEWQARWPDGSPFVAYPNNYTMVAPFQAWQDYISAIAVRLVRDYGADGIFLDSWAWRLNLPVSNAAGSYVLYSPLQFTQGVEKLTEKVRDAVRAVKQDAIVMGETTSGPMGHHWDGGLSADFTFPDSVRANRDRILASPARYGIPEVNYISNGGNLNELHQIYAAGYGLALCCNGPVNPAGQNFIQSNADHIRNLVKIRQGYKDALIYGRQSYQPAADREGVSAYFYHGTAHDIITVVNTTDKDANVVLLLNAAEADSKWNDLLTVQTAAAVGQKLKVNVAAQGLLVLLRQPGP